MRTTLAILVWVTLGFGCEAANDAEALSLGAAAGSPAVAVDVDVEAVCAPPVNFTTVRSNNGAAINESSYKTRSLRTWVNIWFCPGTSPGVNNAWTCTSDHCDAVTAANNYRLSGCFDLPSCAGPDCRECTLQQAPRGTSSWSDTGLKLHYQQGYGFATWLDVNNNFQVKYQSFTTENPARVRQLY